MFGVYEEIDQMVFDGFYFVNLPSQFFIDSMNFCANCGQNLQSLATARFCPTCGSPINQNQSSAILREESKSNSQGESKGGGGDEDDADLLRALAESKLDVPIPSAAAQSKFSSYLSAEPSSSKPSSSKELAVDSVESDHLLAMRLASDDEAALAESKRSSTMEEDDHELAMRMQNEEEGIFVSRNDPPPHDPELDVDTTLNYTDPNSHESRRTDVKIRDAR